MNKIKYASAFAGIGGMTLGLKDLGFEGVAAWEYDPTEKKTQYAQNAHKLLHPEIPLHGDICNFDTELLPDFDVFCFTPPCQAFSVAGKRGGFEDTRGTLTFEALKIAKDKKPKVLFMENVKGLINHDKGNTMGVIINAINEIGYTVDFAVLNSKYFDVAQNRERVYLIGVRDDLIPETPWIDINGNTMLPKAKKRYQQEGVKTFNFNWPEQKEVRTRLRDFLDDKVDEKYFLAEDKTAALVKQLEDGLAVKEATKARFTKATVGDAVNISSPNSTTHRGRVGKQMANTIEASGINQGVVERTDRIIEVGKIKPHRNSSLANSVHSTEGISSTLDTMQGGGREPKILEESPIMLGHIDLKGHDAIKRVYSTTGQGPTLTTMGGGHREPKIAEESHTRYRIRKLTPSECLKLQAVPNWAIEKLKMEFSDSRLYKFAGNGLTTNVIAAIGKEIVNLLEDVNV
jgi:DNA (cytosine-5)-methyltransferase 1